MDSTVYNAAAEGDVHALHQLPGIDLQQQLSPKKNSVLHIAAQFGQLPTVRWILGFPWSSSLLLQHNLKGDIPLHYAAREGHLLVVKALCAAAKLLPLGHERAISAEKAMLRLTNKEGDTALHEGVRYNRCDVVKFLIMEDPDLSAYAENVSCGTPLYMAAERGFRKLVEIIIDNSRTSPAYSGLDGRTALHAAVIQNDSEMTKKILEWKPELTKEVDEHGLSPLHLAACFGCDTTIIRELLDKSDKCAPYLGTKDGNLTALHMAAMNGHMKIVEILASHSPDCCEQVDDEGNNVYHFAMMSRQPYASRHLLKNRWMRSTGLINEKNGEGDTPLHLLFSCYVYDPVFVRQDNVDKMAFNNQKLTAADMFIMAHNNGDSQVIPYIQDYLKEFLGVRKDVGLYGTRGMYGKKNNSSRSTGTRGNVVGNNNDRCESQEQKDLMIKGRGETHLVVATLIATVACTAGFTLPGGYNQSNGMATLSKKAAFTAFLVMDTLAVALSVSAISSIYLPMSLQERSVPLSKHIANGFIFNLSAMAAMVAAFMTGLYAVLPPCSGISISICIICGCIFLFFYRTCHAFLRKAILGFLFDKKHLPGVTLHW